MIIKTLSEVSLDFHQDDYWGTLLEGENLNSNVWKAVADGIKPVCHPLKHSFVLELGQHRVDPNVILAMCLLNLSQKDVLELRIALGILEPTPL